MLDCRLNLKYCIRSVARNLRLVDVEALGATGIDIQKIEDLILFGVAEDWRSMDPPGLNLEELCRLAEAAGMNLTMDLQNGEGLDGWVQGVETAWSPGETSLVPVSGCVVCRHPKRIEMEILMSKGMGIEKLSRLFNLTGRSVSRHRNVCMAGRLERLSQALGTAADVSSLVGTVAVMDGVMEFAKRAGEAALETQEFAAVDSVLGKMLQGVEIRGKLTGEFGNGGSGEEAEGKPQQVGGPQVSVLVVPTREQLESQIAGRSIGNPLARVVDLKGEPA